MFAQFHSGNPQCDGIRGWGLWGVIGLDKVMKVGPMMGLVVL